MSPDEYFAVFHEKYGNDFNWMLTSSDSFACELEMVLCAVYFAGKADDYWNGMGAALIAVGAIKNNGKRRDVPDISHGRLPADGNVRSILFRTQTKILNI